MYEYEFKTFYYMKHELSLLESREFERTHLKMTQVRCDDESSCIAAEWIDFIHLNNSSVRCNDADDDDDDIMICVRAFEKTTWNCFRKSFNLFQSKCARKKYIVQRKNGYWTGPAKQATQNTLLSCQKRGSRKTDDDDENNAVDVMMRRGGWLITSSPSSFFLTFAASSSTTGNGNWARFPHPFYLSPNVPTQRTAADHPISSNNFLAYIFHCNTDSLPYVEKT